MSVVGAAGFLIYKAATALVTACMEATYVDFIIAFSIPVCAIVMPLILIPYAIGQYHKYQNGKWLWIPVRAFRAMRLLIWKPIIRKDLTQRFKERPELSEITVDDLLGAEWHSHHEDEYIPDKTFQKIYALAYKQAQMDIKN